MIKSVIEPNLVCLTSQYMDNNTYLVSNGKEVVVIDPSFNGEDILAAIPKDSKIIAILLTHAHFDHCFDTAKVLSKWNVPVYLHEADKITYTKYRYDDLANMRVKDFDKNIRYFSKSSLLINSFKFDVIHTPGHSSGSVVYKYKNWVFVGDTLFYNSYGRTDLGNSNPIDMMKSLNLLWKELKEENLILPGHNKWATFKEINKNNFIVKEMIKK